MSNKNEGEFNFLSILLMILGVILVVLLMRTGMFVFVALALVATIIVSVFYLISSILKSRKEKQFGKTVVGGVHHHLEECQAQIKRHRSEIRDIKQDIQDLEKKIDPSLQLTEKTAKERQRIMNAFQKELKLRKAKVDFYEICIKKLQALQYNHQIASDLAKKQQKLSLSLIHI